MNTDTRVRFTDGPSGDVAAAVLTDRTRRRVVAALANRAAPITATDLAEELEAAAPDGADQTPSGDLETALHHVHLPRLDDADVLDYDPATATVTAARTARLGALLSERY